MSDYAQRLKNSAHFIRAEITHFDFVTGLNAALNGGSDRVKMKVILNIYEPHLQEGYGMMNGVLFECCQFLEFVNGSYDAGDLKTLNSESKWSTPGFKKPEEFTFETWHAIDEDNYRWQLIKKTTIKGVKWLTAEHTSDGGTRCCAGHTTFNYDSVAVENISNGQIIEIDKNEKYPKQHLKQLV